MAEHLFPKSFRMKQLPILFSILFGLQLQAQEPVDALRYSLMGHGGTARARAIGGAMTSLGGDISAAFINPAGLGLYKSGEFTFTPSLAFNNTKINYLNTESKANKISPDFSNIGLVLPRPGSWNGNWRNFTFGVGMNKTVNFGNSTRLKGTNTESSYSEKYLEELINNNITDPNQAADKFPYGSSLAFNTYLIDTLAGPGGSIRGYRSLSTPQTGVNQQQDITTKGNINDIYFSASGNYLDKLFVGGGITFSKLKFEKTSIFRESDATLNKKNNFNYFETEDYLLTEGVGVGLKLGLIVKPVERLRIGLAFHSPVLYNMDDKYSSKITTDLEGYQGNGVLKQSSLDFNNGELGQFQYDFTNPMRLMAGISYVLNEVADVNMQKGFISADIEYLDYSNAKFSGATTSDDSYLNQVNDAIKEQFRSALNMRLGGELKFKTIMTRLGFNYMGNAYASAPLKARQMNISGGLGYRNMGFFVDLTYVQQLVKDASFPYRLDNGFYEPGNVRASNGNVFLTVGFKF